MRIRSIIEITKDNISESKRMMEFSELRHLDGLKGYFAIVDSRLFASNLSSPDAKTLPHVITSTVKGLVEQQQYFFNTLWEKAIPAELRIREIEEGIPAERTEVLYGVENIISKTLHSFSVVKERLDVCGDHNLAATDVSVEPVRNAFITMKNKGIKIRAVTVITKENLHYCKEMMKFSEMRHLDHVKGNFGVTENDYMAGATNAEGQPLAQAVYSTVKPFIEQQQLFFETLWNKAIPADQRIKEIVEGIEPEFVKVITDGNEAAKIIVEFAKSVKKEAQLLLPYSKTMVRADKLGVWDYLVDAANNGAGIRIICPLSSDNLHIVNRIAKDAPTIKILNGETASAGMFIVDNVKYFKAEDKNPDAAVVSDAISFMTYSNSKNGIDSFRSIFDALWKQTELYEQLKINDKLQKEFMDIAAHELRTPIQPILGLAEVLRDQAAIGEPNQSKKLLEAIVRNARRLQKLQEDILAVTRIESHLLTLEKERINLDEFILQTVADNFSDEIIKEEKVKIVYDKINANDDSSAITVYADKSRLSQVILNLLGNALKFTKEGTIQIAVEKATEVIVSIRDTGCGIDPEIMPRLFTKFASKSVKGTGLGLYISKNIIEAHGGRMWAENNQDGKGATFIFTLPLA